MNKTILLVAVLFSGFFSCNQGNKSASNSEDLNNTASKKSEIQNQKANITTNKFYSKFEYNETNGAKIIIQNSFPKSGIKYTDPIGKNFRYCVFWTQIKNETNNPIELSINFPVNSFEIPTASGNFMTLHLPKDTVTISKESMFDYGLSVKSFLDKNRSKSSSLNRIINPKDSTAFYVVSLSRTGVKGTLRTGFNLKGTKLFYTINDKEIPCGTIDLTKLMKSK